MIICVIPLSLSSVGRHDVIIFYYSPFSSPRAKKNANGYFFMSLSRSITEFETFFDV
jgi:hypothetical protein